MAGQFQAQQFGQGAATAQAQNAINQFNVGNTQNVAGYNTQAQNQAQAANLANQQNISNTNVGLQNQQQAHNTGLYQQQFGDQMQQAAGESGMDLANSGYQSNQASQLAGAISGGVSGLSSGMGAAFGAYAGGQVPSYSQGGQVNAKMSALRGMGNNDKPAPKEKNASQILDQFTKNNSPKGYDDGGDVSGDGIDLSSLINKPLDQFGMPASSMAIPSSSNFVMPNTGGAPSLSPAGSSPSASPLTSSATANPNTSNKDFENKDAQNAFMQQLAKAQMAQQAKAQQAPASTQNTQQFNTGVANPLGSLATNGYAGGGEVAPSAPQISDSLAPYMPTKQEEENSGLPPGPQRAAYMAHQKKKLADMANDPTNTTPGYDHGGEVSTLGMYSMAEGGYVGGSSADAIRGYPVNHRGYDQGGQVDDSAASKIMAGFNSMGMGGKGPSKDDKKDTGYAFGGAVAPRAMRPPQTLMAPRVPLVPKPQMGTQPTAQLTPQQKAAILAKMAGSTPAMAQGGQVQRNSHNQHSSTYSSNDGSPMPSQQRQQQDNAVQSMTPPRMSNGGEAQWDFNTGGNVRAKVSPQEGYIKPEAAKAVADGAVPAKKVTEKIPGKAKVAGDSPKNDTIPAKLEAGGLVIPRTVMNSDDDDAIMHFVKGVLAHKKSSRN